MIPVQYWKSGMRHELNIVWILLYSSSLLHLQTVDYLIKNASGFCQLLLISKTKCLLYSDYHRYNSLFTWTGSGLLHNHQYERYYGKLRVVQWNPYLHIILLNVAASVVHWCFVYRSQTCWSALLRMLRRRVWKNASRSVTVSSRVCPRKVCLACLYIIATFLLQFRSRRTVVSALHLWTVSAR